MVTRVTEDMSVQLKQGLDELKERVSLIANTFDLCTHYMHVSCVQVLEAEREAEKAEEDVMQALERLKLYFERELQKTSSEAEEDRTKIKVHYSLPSLT